MPQNIIDLIESKCVDSDDLLKFGNNSEELQLSLSLDEGKKTGSTHGLLPFIKLSDRLKKIFKNEIELREGLKLVIIEYKLKKNVTVGFTINHKLLEFAYCLSGKISVIIQTAEGKTEELKINKAMNLIFSFPNSKGKIQIFAEEPVKIISVHISPEFLKKFIDTDSKLLPDELQHLLNKNLNRSFVFTGSITPEMQIAANQIDECKFTGMAKKMYLESKALELMTLQLAEFDEIFKYKQTGFNIKEHEMKLLSGVKNRLIQNLTNPPSLKELATLSGMTHTKLNTNFKIIYGTTIFEYFRKYRLEYSRFLLTENKLNITEIAYESGWSSPSHFSKEFLKLYGITPKNYQKSIIVNN